MTDKIRAAFGASYSEGTFGSEAMQEAMYEVFAKGFTAGEAKPSVPAVNVPAPRMGFAITVIESEAGWGSKRDGYMVGFTIDDLEKRKVTFETNNSADYGLYYERPNDYVPVILSEEAVEKMLACDHPDRYNCIWFDNLSEFQKGD